MAATFFYFDVHYAVKVHDWIIENSGGCPGSNNLGLLESALEHIQNDLYYPEIHHTAVFPKMRYSAKPGNPRKSSIRQIKLYSVAVKTAVS